MGKYDYSRSVRRPAPGVEKAIANLEGGFGDSPSPQAWLPRIATMLLRTGDHILAGSDIYGGTIACCIASAIALVSRSLVQQIGSTNWSGPFVPTPR